MMVKLKKFITVHFIFQLAFSSYFSMIYLRTKLLMQRQFSNAENHGVNLKNPLTHFLCITVHILDIFK